MLNIEVKGVIIGEADRAWMALWGQDSQVFTVENVRQALTDNPNEKEVTLNLDCDGGSVAEGFKIYDELRMSGRTIYANIAGSCHSMAIIILLAAPAENRSGNKNIRALVHPVSQALHGALTAVECEKLQAELKAEEDAILDIYEERTEQPRDILAELMANSTMCDADTLLKYNFISKINSYNTNQFFNRMTNPIKSAYDAFVARRNAYKKTYAPANVAYEYKDKEGNVVFTSEVPPEELAEGSVVTILDGSVSGIFTLDDGREVEVSDNVVDSISVTATQTMEERIAELEAMLDDATNLVATQQAEIANLNEAVKANTGSTHTPKANRAPSMPSAVLAKGVVAEQSVESLKAQAREARAKVHTAKTIIKQ